MDVTKISEEDALDVAKICYHEDENWSENMRTSDKGREFIFGTYYTDEDNFNVFGLNFPHKTILKVHEFIKSKKYTVDY